MPHTSCSNPESRQVRYFSIAGRLKIILVLAIVYNKICSNVFTTYTERGSNKVSLAPPPPADQSSPPVLALPPGYLADDPIGKRGAGTPRGCWALV